jgi:hypothetical protein
MKLDDISGATLAAWHTAKGEIEKQAGHKINDEDILKHLIQDHFTLKILHDNGRIK